MAKRERAEFHRQWYAAKRAAAVERLGGKCAVCGSEDNLEFDHIDMSTKSFDVSPNLNRKDVQRELDKCQLLCHTCHEEKTDREDGHVPFKQKKFCVSTPVGAGAAP